MLKHLGVVFLVVFSWLTPCRATSENSSVHLFGRGPHPLVDLGQVDPTVPSPEQFLGSPLAEPPARYAQVIQYFRHLDSTSPRVAVFTMGSTYEGRELIYAVMSTPERMARLAEVQRDLQSLRDPRALSAAQIDELVKRTPVCAWLAYSIHGDEISGVDAALGLAYRLAAGTDSLTLRLLNELVIVIDPMQNPDGRERYLAQVEAFASAVPTADGQSMQKGGFWPWGRGNHYLFDMNRDWFAQELLESQARVSAMSIVMGAMCLLVMGKVWIV